MRISDWSSDVCSSDLNPEVTTLAAFVGELADEWRAQNAGCPLLLSDRATAQADPRIVADAALKQVIWNVLDNARDASNKAILLLVERTGRSDERSVGKECGSTGRPRGSA